MKHNREQEIIACCESIKKNAEMIAADFEHNQNFEIKIQFLANEVPTVKITKTYIPKELLDLWQSGDYS